MTGAQTAETIVLPYNDLAAVEAAFAEQGADIACVITEAAAGNMGAVAPLPGFNAGLREITARHGALLISGRGDDRIPGFCLAVGTGSIRSMPTCSRSAR